MENKEVPIMKVSERGVQYWVADSHVEEYSEEPTRWQMIWGLLKGATKEFLSKLKDNK